MVGGGRHTDEDKTCGSILLNKRYDDGREVESGDRPITNNKKVDVLSKFTNRKFSTGTK